MKTSTIKDLLGHIPKGFSLNQSYSTTKSRENYNCIYVIKDNNHTAVYVGQAGVTSVSNRIGRHIIDVFLRQGRSSLISNHLWNNHPDYFDWNVEIYTITDVKQKLHDPNLITCLNCAEQAIYDHYVTKQRGIKIIGNARRPHCP